MENLIQLSPTEVQLAFAASCVEGTARRWSVPYTEIVARMKRTGMLENFILPFYEELHSESREHVIDSVAEYLTVRGEGV